MRQEDGIYCVMFLKNVVDMLIQKCEEQAEESEYQESLDLIWQELHVIMNKLTQT